MIAGHHTLFHVKFNDDLPLWRGPAIKKKCMLITREILHSRDVHCNYWGMTLIYFCNERDHAIPLFLCSNILSDDILYFRSISLMYDIHSKHAPTNLLDFFSEVDSMHSSNT